MEETSMIVKRVLIYMAFISAFSAATALAGGLKFVVNTLDLGGPPATATLDMTNTSGIVHTTPYSTILDYVTSGYDYGVWDGIGIQSSTAAAEGGATTMGSVEGWEYLQKLTDFYGVTIVDNDSVIKYTWSGDADLDGSVNDDDLAAGFLFNYLTYLDTGIPTPSDYFGGDFTYDGVVDDNDLGALLPNYLTNPAPLSGAAAPSTIPIPEPSTVVLLISAMVLSLFMWYKKS
jgi:hypothetical protein